MEWVEQYGKDRLITTPEQTQRSEAKGSRILQQRIKTLI